MSAQKRIESILVAVDTRLERHPVVERAAELAAAFGSRITIVDVVPTLSWMASWASEAERLRRDARETVERRLEQVAKGLLHRGIEVAWKVLDGVAWQAVVDEVREGEHHLVLAVSKGHDSTIEGPYGLTARRLLRHCPAPLWLVHPSSAAAPRHVVACLDTYEDGADAELNERAFALAVRLRDQLGAQLSVLHAWKMEDEAILSARLTEAQVKRFADEHEAYRRERLERFLRTFGEDGGNVGVHLIKADPAEAVATFCADEGADLVVMGTVARGGLRGLVLGNTAEAILEGIDTSVLAVKPFGFRSPLI